MDQPPRRGRGRRRGGRMTVCCWPSLHGCRRTSRGPRRGRGRPRCWPGSSGTPHRRTYRWSSPTSPGGCRRDGSGSGGASCASPSAAASTPTLTVRDVDAALDALAEVSGTGAQAERRRLVQELMAAATEEEQRFLVGLLTGEVRQGALDALAVEGLAAATDAPAADVRRAVMLAGSLQDVARALLAEGPGALAEFRLTVGRPVGPMLAHSARSGGGGGGQARGVRRGGEARRHPGAGAPGRCGRADLHPHPGRGHRPAAGGHRRRPGPPGGPLHPGRRGDRPGRRRPPGAVPARRGPLRLTGGRRRRAGRAAPVPGVLRRAVPGRP